MKLEKKVAIITGAGRGIGKAIAFAFAREGADLLLLSRTLPELKSTAKEIKALNRNVLVLKTDVSNGMHVQKAIDFALSEFGKVDILVNNAAIQGPIGSLADNDVEKWIETININLIGV
ncbi:SDR family NAD(P)-dependent oxidoreductase, partial [Candidatus Poribacteria bacterium]|nr:SDR family NAD(P)-dependent oxidoreductase [Candidatus Poribacteria bacterium]